MQAVQVVLSCPPGASLLLRRLSNSSFPASLVPPWCRPGCPISPSLPPWCLPGAAQAVEMVLSSLVPPCSLACPNAPFLPPWCLLGASQAVQLVVSCLPGASLVLHGCPFPASLVPRRLSKWSFCFPGASVVPPRLSNESFPASPVPRRLSKWSLPASLVPPWCLVSPWCLPGCPPCCLAGCRRGYG